jgi:5'(3')-deoxyribonucleotidase
MKKKIVYFDMDGVLCQYTKRFNEELERNPKIQFPQATYGFFVNLEPHDMMVALYKALEKNEYYEVYILTAPSYLNPLCYTEKRVWVENHIGLKAAQSMIISGYKNLLKGDYLIDDNIIGRGQDQFEGKLLHVDEDNIKESLFSILIELRENLEEDLGIS